MLHHAKTSCQPPPKTLELIKNLPFVELHDEHIFAILLYSAELYEDYLDKDPVKVTLTPTRTPTPTLTRTITRIW